MGDDLPTEYDHIILGTGLQESILAAALSRIGRRVLHLDRNDYYSGEWASFNLHGLLEFIEKNERSQEIAGNEETSSPSGDSGLPPSALEEGESLIELPQHSQTIFNLDVTCHVSEGADPVPPQEPTLPNQTVSAPDSHQSEPDLLQSEPDILQSEPDISQSHNEAEASSAQDATPPSIGAFVESASASNGDAGVTVEVTASSSISAAAEQDVSESDSHMEGDTGAALSERTDFLPIQSAQQIEGSVPSYENANNKGSEQDFSSEGVVDRGQRSHKEQHDLVESGRTLNENVSTPAITDEPEGESAEQDEGCVDQPEGESAEQEQVSVDQPEGESAEQDQGSVDQPEGESAEQDQGSVDRLGTAAPELQGESSQGQADDNAGQSSGQVEEGAAAPITRDWTWRDMKVLWRKFNIDLAPKLMFCRGSMVETLVTSRISRYAEFKAVTRILTVIKDKLEHVPCSRSDVFSSRYVSMLEKRMLMKLIEFVMRYQERADDYEAYKDRPFSEFLKFRKLTPTLQHFVIYSIAMVRPTTPTEEALQAMQFFLKSLGRYGNTAFLWTLYGSGELPQCFCRMSAVFGGIYMLRTTAKSMIVDENNSCKAIIDTEGRRLSCNNLIMQYSYPVALPEMDKESFVSRGVLLTDRTLKESDHDQITFLTIPPPETEDAPIRVIELGEGSYASPKDIFVVHLTRKSKSVSAKEDLEYAVKLLFQNEETDNDQNSEKPRILWSMFFSMRDWSSDSVDSLRTGQPSNVYITTGPGSSVGFEHAVKQAQEIFQTICPDEEFLPPAPDPEDIVFEDPHQDNPGHGNKAGFEEDSPKTTIKDDRKDEEKTKEGNKSPEEVKESKDEATESKDEATESKDEATESKDEATESKDEATESKDDAAESKAEASESKDDAAESKAEAWRAKMMLQRVKLKLQRVKLKLQKVKRNLKRWRTRVQMTK